MGRPLQFDVGTLFPTIEAELGPFRHLLKGRVLNAGCGNRDLSPLVDGELVNQDIAEGLHNANVDIYSPLHEIPVPDGHFDAIVCNAVLEHVRNPDEVLDEFARVCRPGGVLYLTVPFMQPEHLDPTDFQRYTADGLRALVDRHGFATTEVRDVHSVYTTLAWIVYEWLRSLGGVRARLLSFVVLRPLRRRARTSQRQVHSIASAYSLTAVRRGGEDEA